MNNNPPLASERHLFGFFLILAGIATASWLMARHPFSHRFLLYLTLIAMELLRVWYVIAGARANGNGVMNIVGRGWNTWRDCPRDCLLAIGTIVVVAVTARSFFCSAIGCQTLHLCCQPTSVNQRAGSCSQLPAASVRKSRIAAICNGSSGLSFARSPLPSAYRPSLSARFIFTRDGNRLSLS